MGGSVEARDFRVQIGLRSDFGYEVSFRTPDGGESTAVMELPLPAAELNALADRIPDAVLASSVRARRSVSGDEHPVRRMGGMLFDALLAGDPGGVFSACRDQAHRDGGQLRIVLQVRPPELSRLPWEFLYDSREDDYVCLDTPLIRYPQVKASVLPLQVTPPLRVLCMAARPGDQETLATETEQRKLRDTLSGLEQDGLVEVGVVAGGTWRDLQYAMRRGPWHVFHFSGHGGFDSATQEGTLALAGEDGSTCHLGAEDMAMLLRKHPSLRLVLLNACEGGRAATLDPFSSVAGALIRRGVPAVLAMQYRISDEAALEFGRTFYEHLAEQLPVELCVQEARQAVRLAQRGSLEWGTPVLYMRTTDGVLFRMTDAAAGSSTALTAEAKPPPDPAPGPVDAAGHRPEQQATPDGIQVTLVTTISAPAVMHSIAFSPDSGRLAFGCDKHRAVVADLTGRIQLKIRHGSLDQSVRGVVFDRLGRRLATAGDDCGARIWDATTGSRLLRVVHDKAVLSVDFSSDGLMLATGSADATARIWDATTGQRLRRITLDDRVPSVAFSPDGLLLATASWDGTARIWDVPTGRCRLEAAHLKQVMSVAFSPDGLLLATASWDGTARIWDVPTGRCELEVSPGDQVWSVAFSPDGRMLATGSHDGTARIWDATTGGRLFAGAHTAAVCCVTFSPDGRMFATGSLDKTVQLWRLIGPSDG